jgi:hypothetical protein
MAALDLGKTAKVMIRMPKVFNVLKFLTKLWSLIELASMNLSSCSSGFAFWHALN